MSRLGELVMPKSGSAAAGTLNTKSSFLDDNQSLSGVNAGPQKAKTERKRRASWVKALMILALEEVARHRRNRRMQKLQGNTSE